MEIMLIRHGTSQCLQQSGQTADEYRRWKENYDRLGVMEPTCNRFTEASMHIQAAEVVFTSSLLRTQHSLAFLNPAIEAVQDAVFDEIHFAPPNVRGLRLSTPIWSLFIGAFWYYGLLQSYETRTQVRKRAESASNLLVQASEKGNVALVGHGFFNLFIFQELKRRGWKRINRYKARNWSCTRLRLE